MQRDMLLYFGNRDPGVAKFGIALDWGSRGRGFKSRHSDQSKNPVTSVTGFLLCIFHYYFFSFQYSLKM